MIDIRRGLEILKKNIRIAPEKPGVYRMLGEGGKVLYVGKAKNIKKRIVAYSHIEKLPVRLQRMVSEIERMEFIVVENEARALLLENELIKKLVLAWDPDFTKLTTEEAKQLEEAKDSGFVDAEEIDWSKIGHE